MIERSNPSTWPAVVGAFLLVLAMQLPMLGVPHYGGTEGHRVIPAIEMRATGDWIVPHLFGMNYGRKPPGQLWTLAAFQSTLGNTEFVNRLPSVLSLALLAGACAWLCGRWFGVRRAADPSRLAAWAGGLAAATLVPLWSQARTADIDANHTFFAALTALLLLELHCGGRTKRVAWAIAAGAAFGIALLFKGPACLPPIVGVLLAGMVIRLREVEPRVGRFVGFVLPVIIGIGMFGVWFTLWQLRLRGQGGAVDEGGLDEAAQNLVPQSIDELIRALGLPFVVLAYALPHSLTLFTAGRDELRRTFSNDVPRGAMLAVGFAFLICVLSGMTNERYAYPILPLLVPLVAATIATPPQVFDAFEKLRVGFGRFGAIATTIFSIVMAWMAIAEHSRWWLIAVAGAAASGIAMTVGVYLYRRRDVLRGEWLGAALSLAFAAVPFAIWHAAAREERSAYGAAQGLRAAITNNSPILVGRVAREQPELFLYANLWPQHIGETFENVDAYDGNTWVVLSTRAKRSEWDQWKKSDRLKAVTRVPALRGRSYVVGLLQPKVTGVSSEEGGHAALEAGQN